MVGLQRGGVGLGHLASQREGVGRNAFEADSTGPPQTQTPHSVLQASVYEVLDGRVCGVVLDRVRSPKNGFRR